MYQEVFAEAKPHLPSLLAKAKKLQHLQGKNTLHSVLGRMSKRVGLSTHFTPHCIPATSVTILKAAGLKNLRVTKVMPQSRQTTKGRKFNNRCSPRQQSVILWLKCKRVMLLLSNTPLRSQEVLLKHCSKTRAMTKFAASINSPMSALNKPSERGPELVIGYFSKLYFQVLSTVCVKKTSEQESSEVFCEAFFAKVHVFRVSLFENEQSQADRKNTEFSDSYTYILANVRCKLLTFVTGCTHE